MQSLNFTSNSNFMSYLFNFKVCQRALIDDFKAFNNTRNSLSMFLIYNTKVIMTNSSFISN